MMPHLNENDRSYKNDGFGVVKEVRESIEYNAEYISYSSYISSEQIEEELYTKILYQMLKDKRINVIEEKHRFEEKYRVEKKYRAQVRVVHEPVSYVYKNIFKIGSEEFNEEEIKIALKNYYPDRLI